MIRCLHPPATDGAVLQAVETFELRSPPTPRGLSHLLRIPVVITSNEIG